MEFKLISGLFLLLGITHHVNSAKLEPPKFLIPQGSWSFAGSQFIVRPSKEHKIKCVAGGFPTPTYQWYRNGDLLRTKQNEVEYNKQTGTLTIGESFPGSSGGLYQCVAKNSQGIAISPYLTVTLAKAVIFKSIPGQDLVVLTTVAATKYFKMPCSNMPLSIPDKVIQWKSETKESIKESERIIFDPYGNLHFLWVKSSDAEEYTCGYSNTLIGTDVWNIEKQRIVVTDGLVPTDIAPDIRFHEDVVVKAGDEAKLLCIFSYYSTKEKLKVKWFLKGKWINQADFNNRNLSGAEYKIANADVSDEGAYMCIGSVGKSSARATVELTVTSPPKFIKFKSPNETFAPVGSDAVFYCEASSHNAHKTAPVWMVNSEPIVGALPTHFMCSKKNITTGYPISVSKSKLCDQFPDCPDGSDEEGCPESCIEGQVSCNNKCVLKDEPCNELECDWPDFMCNKDYSCIQFPKLCNNVSDCSDGSDEADCPGGSDFKVSRYIFNSQRTTMTIPDVQLHETLCVQCAISNPFGTEFGGGCLTVIDKIHIHSKPNITYNVSPGMTFDLYVNATTDPFYSDQLKYTWYHYREVENETTGLTETKEIEIPGEYLRAYFTPYNNNNLIKVTLPSDPHNNDEEFKVYTMLAGEEKEGREYSLIVSHPHDRYEYNFTIVGDEVLPPVIVPVIQQASSNLWLIAVILGIIVLIALIIFIVCMVCKRDPRGAYYVDKKEHEAGNDPEQELKDSGFHDVGRVGSIHDTVQYDDDNDIMQNDADNDRQYDAENSKNMHYDEEKDTFKFGVEIESAKYNVPNGSVEYGARNVGVRGGEVNSGVVYDSEDEGVKCDKESESEQVEKAL